METSKVTQSFFFLEIADEYLVNRNDLTNMKKVLKFGYPDVKAIQVGSKYRKLLKEDIFLNAVVYQQRRIGNWIARGILQ